MTNHNNIPSNLISLPVGVHIDYSEDSRLRFSRDELVNKWNNWTPEAIAIVGCNGGAWTALLFALSKVKRIYLFDDDLVEEHNRNRVFWRKEDVGRNKAEALKDIIEPVAFGQVYAFPMRFNIDNFPYFEFLFLSANPEFTIDLVIDATDSEECRQLMLELDKIKDEGRFERYSIPGYIREGCLNNTVECHNYLPKGIWGTPPPPCSENPQWLIPQLMSSIYAYWTAFGISTDGIRIGSRVHAVRIPNIAKALFNSRKYIEKARY